MKKSGLILAIAVFFLTAWIGITYVVGNKAEIHYRNLLAEASRFGFITLTNQSYERGFLSSTATTLMEIDFPAVQTMAELAPNEETPDDSDDMLAERTIRLEFDHVFHHGPLPVSSGPASRYGFGPAIALVETSLARFSPDQQGLDNLLEEIPALKETVSIARIDFDGTTESLLEIPAFSYPIEDGTVSSDGFRAESTYLLTSGDMAGSFDLRNVEVTAADGGGMTWQGVSGDFDLAKILPMLYVGTSQAEVGQMEMRIPSMNGEAANTISMEAMQMTSNSRYDGSMVHYEQTTTFGGLTIDGEVYGPLTIDAETRNLDAEVLSEFQQQVLAVYREADNLDPDALAGMVLPIYVDLLGKLLAGHPEMNVRRFSLVTPKGTAEGNLRVSVSEVGGATDDTVAGLLNYIPYIDAEANLSVDERLVRALLLEKIKNGIKDQIALAEKMDQETGFSEERIAEMAQQSTTQQLDMMIAQQYIVRDGEKIKTSMTFKNGKLMVNGQIMPLFQGAR